jgi:hypothetical protein
MLGTSKVQRALGGAIMLGALSASGGVQAVTFNAAVEQILLAQRSGPLMKLNPDNKREMVACVVSALTGVPEGRKRYVTEASSFDAMQDRFGEVVMENRAEWKQKIAKRCAGIATRRQPK